MGDNFKELPIVRFKTQTSAEKALAALESGQVFLDGFQLKGKWKGGGGRQAPARTGPRPAIPPRAFDDGGSRMMMDRGGGGGGGDSRGGGDSSRRESKPQHAKQRSP